MRKLLSEAGFVRPTGIDQTDPWDLMEADQIAPFLDGLGHFVSAADLQKMLNISRSQFNLPRRDGYRHPLWTAQTTSPSGTFRLSGCFSTTSLPMASWSICSILTGFTSRPRHSGSRSGPAKSLGGQSAKSRIGLAGKDGYEAIAVNILATGKLFHRRPVAGMSVEAFAKSHGLKPRAAMILVRGGHVPSVMERNPKAGQHQPFLTPASITTFQPRFAPLRTLARQLGRSWQAVPRDLDAANVSPFLPEGHDIGSVYEWSVLERNGCCRSES